MSVASEALPPVRAFTTFETVSEAVLMIVWMIDGVEEASIGDVVACPFKSCVTRFVWVVLAVDVATSRVVVAVVVAVDVASVEVATVSGVVVPPPNEMILLISIMSFVYVP